MNNPRLPQTLQQNMWNQIMSQPLYKDYSIIELRFADIGYVLPVEKNPPQECRGFPDLCFN